MTETLFCQWYQWWICHWCHWLPLVPLVTIKPWTVLAASDAHGAIGRASGANGTIGKCSDLWMIYTTTYSLTHVRPPGMGRSRVQSLGSATFFRGDWSWNHFYGHSLPTRAVVTYWRKDVTSGNVSNLPPRRSVEKQFDYFPVVNLKASCKFPWFKDRWQVRFFSLLKISKNRRMSCT